MLEINLLDGYNEEKDYYTYVELEERMGSIGGNFRKKIVGLLEKGTLQVRPRPTGYQYNIEEEWKYTDYKTLKKKVSDTSVAIPRAEKERLIDPESLQYESEAVDLWKTKRKSALVLTVFSGVALFLLAEQSQLSQKLAVWLFGADPSGISEPNSTNSSQNIQKEEVKIEKITTIQAKIAKKRDELARAEASLGQWQEYQPETPDDQVQKIIELATLRERIATLHELLQELEQELKEVNKH